MNKRIKLLAEQAGIHFHKGGTLDAGPNGIAKFVLYSDMEKFAELLVRECMSKTAGYLLEDEFSGPDVKEASEELAKYFGVEQ